MIVLFAGNPSPEAEGAADLPESLRLVEGDRVKIAVQEDVFQAGRVQAAEGFFEELTAEAQDPQARADDQLADEAVPAVGRGDADARSFASGFGDETSGRVAL